jgi:hypothetical protein
VIITIGVGFVLSTNLHRRHLNEGQRAMVAAKLTDLEMGANQYSEGVSIDTASRLLNVSRSSVNRARRVLRDGDPGLVGAVELGEVSVAAAADKPKRAKKRSTRPSRTFLLASPIVARARPIGMTWTAYCEA